MNKTDYPYLASVDWKANDSLKITISGHWPTPSWKLIEAKHEIDMNSREIKIHIIGETSGGLALQMLQPFSKALELKLPDYSNWTLIVKGKSKDIIKKID